MNRETTKILLSLCLFFWVFIFLFHNDNSQTRNTVTVVKVKNSENEIHEIEYYISDYEDEWAFANDGSFKTFYNNDENSWGDDEKIAIEGIDINLNIAKEYKIYRECIVAVIDGDFDLENNLLKKNMWINKGEISNDLIDNDNNGYIDDVNGWNFVDNSNDLLASENISEHGTHTASIISKMIDVSAQIMYLKVLHGENSTGRVENVIRAIRYAEDNGAKICNLSLVTNIDYPNLREVISKSSMLFVVAAGNNSVNIDDSENYKYPACYDFDNIITVADIRCDGKLSNISNFGVQNVDVAAPGTNVVGYISGERFAYFCGTSSACAFVAGKSALIYSHAIKELTPKEIKKFVLSSVTMLEGLNGKVKSGGIINVYKALKE